MKKNKVKYSKLKSWIDFYKSKKPLPSGLIICFGARGSGKSTDIAKDELNWEKQKKEFKGYTDFYTNVYINTHNPHYHYLDLVNYKLTDYIPINDKTNNARCFTNPMIDNKGNLTGLADTPFKINENSIIELDELGIVAHSRDFKNFPLEFVRFIKYLRKLGILMKANSQSYDIDKTIREGASELRLKRKIGHFSISRLILKKIVVDNKNDKINQTAENQIHDELKFANILTPHWLKITFIPFYTNRFNSFI